MKTRVILSLLFLLSLGSVRAADLFVEAESFSNKGGWKVDQQFMDLMGSPYLLAHGMGVPSMMHLRKSRFQKKENIMYMFGPITGLPHGKKGKVPVNSVCLSEERR